MAFTTASAPNVLSLIDAIRVFAVANGWTNNHYDDDGAGKRLHLSKNGCFINLRAVNNEFLYNFPTVIDLEQNAAPYALYANLSTAFAGSGSAWYKQTGATNRVDGAQTIYEYCGIASVTGANTYYLFAFDNCIFVIVETPAGYFHWLGFGNIAKIGDWEGGAFLFAKNAPNEGNNFGNNFPLFGQFHAGQGNQRSYLRVNSIDSSSGYARGSGSGGTGNIRPEKIFDSIQISTQLWENTPNIFSGKPVLQPISVLMTRNAGTVDINQPASVFGYLENIYFLNLSGLIPASVYPDGTGAEFRIFPFHHKADELVQTPPNFSTGTLGIAIRSN